jgi:hypothetical protein
MTSEWENKEKVVHLFRCFVRSHSRSNRSCPACLDVAALVPRSRGSNPRTSRSPLFFLSSHRLSLTSTFNDPKVPPTYYSTLSAPSAVPSVFSHRLPHSPHRDLPLISLRLSRLNNPTHPNGRHSEHSRGSLRCLWNGHGAALFLLRRVWSRPLPVRSRLPEVGEFCRPISLYCNLDPLTTRFAFSRRSGSLTRRFAAKKVTLFRSRSSLRSSTSKRRSTSTKTRMGSSPGKTRMRDFSPMLSSVQSRKHRCVFSLPPVHIVRRRAEHMRRLHCALVLLTRTLRLPQTLLASLQEGEICDLDRGKLTLLLIGIRSSLVYRKHHVLDPTGDHQVPLPQHTLSLETMDPHLLTGHYAAEFAMALNGAGLYPYPLEACRYSQILHQLLVYSALRFRQHRGNLSSPTFPHTLDGQKLKAYLFASQQRLVDTLNVVHLEDRRISAALRQLFFTVFDGTNVSLLGMGDGGDDVFVLLSME